jgi:hypothetical protein
MTSITIALDDAQIEQLKHLADQRGQTIEDAIHDLLDGLLAEEEAAMSGTGVHGATLALAGAIDDPTIRPLTAREIDELLADEYAGVHDGQ